MEKNKIDIVNIVLRDLATDYLDNVDFSRDYIKDFLLSIYIDEDYFLEPIPSNDLIFIDEKSYNGMKCTYYSGAYVKTVDSDHQKNSDFVEISNINKSKRKNYTKDLIEKSKYEIILNPAYGYYNHMVNYVGYHMMLQKIEGFFVVDRYYNNLGVKLYLLNYEDVLKVHSILEKSDFELMLGNPNPMLPSLSDMNIVYGKLQNNYINVLSKVLENFIKDNVYTLEDINNCNINNLHIYIELLTKLSIVKNDISLELLIELRESINRMLNEFELEKKFIKYLSKER